MRPGRDCPADYGLGPRAFRDQPELAAEVVYVVGGLYGNPVALDAIESLFEGERTQAKRIVFNGDFHWFDRDRAQFAAIESRTRAHHRLRGNVETELARGDDAAGCGCAYPEQVDEATVERSNRILAALKEAARASGCAAALGALPMVARVRVGDCGVAITHGDDLSLAGWRLSRERVARSWRDGLADSLRAIGAQLVASSHTCEPLVSVYEQGCEVLAAVNNGAAGMANFAGSASGLITRIALGSAPLPARARSVHRIAVAGADVRAIEVPIDLGAWLEVFDRQWPPGSDAALSYRRRVAGGTRLKRERLRVDPARAAACA